ncbi:MAG: hypothetical protein ACXVIY_03145 [Mucilaginibacter sp.]
MRKIGAIASGHYAVFAKGPLQASPAFVALHKADVSTGIPAYGKITVKGKVFYYCRYGFVNDPDIYAKAQGKSKKAHTTKNKN